MITLISLELMGMNEGCINIQEESKLERVNNIAFKSFEFMESLGGVSSCTLSITVVNRSPGSSMNSSN